jgi:hypothetical protein
MRAYMYAAGHGRPRQARHVLRGWTPAAIPCTGCASCSVRCALGFNVRERALAVARVLESATAVT